jgi:hypothetical protein
VVQKECACEHDGDAKKETEEAALHLEEGRMDGVRRSICWHDGCADHKGTGAARAGAHQEKGSGGLRGHES